jgi:hypothetical protein
MTEPIQCPHCGGEAVMPCPCPGCQYGEAWAYGTHRDVQCGLCEGAGVVDEEQLDAYRNACGVVA